TGLPSRSTSTTAPPSRFSSTYCWNTLSMRESRSGANAVAVGAPTCASGVEMYSSAIATTIHFFIRLLRPLEEPDIRRLSSYMTAHRRADRSARLRRRRTHRRNIDRRVEREQFEHVVMRRT